MLGLVGGSWYEIHASSFSTVRFRSGRFRYRKDRSRFEGEDGWMTAHFVEQMVRLGVFRLVGDLG